MPEPAATPNTKADKLEALKAKKAAIEAQIARLNAATAAEQRKLDTRKKILVGAVVLEEAERNPQVADWLQKQLARGLKQPRDRAVFNLPPLPANDAGGEKEPSNNGGMGQA